MKRNSSTGVTVGFHDQVDILLDEAECHPFVGWDFSWIQGRLESLPLPWEYSASVVAEAKVSPDLLDLGTGGGEWLAGLPFRPARTVATEGWPPNVEVARNRLEPLGVEVVQVEPARDNSGKRSDEPPPRLPFDDGSFHLIVDRHESFEPTEVARVLAPGGWFITQQVDAEDDGYRRLLGLDVPPLDPELRWEAWLPSQLAAVGLHVVEYACAPLVQVIRDVGALAWYLNAMPWMVPEFSIEGYRGRLREMQAEINLNGPIEVSERRFWVRATKPG